MRKNVEGAVPFPPVSMIDRAAGYAAAELRSDNDLHRLGRDRFIERLAYHYDLFNYVHPFREDNGRTQRAFWGRVAHDAGWQLDWRAVYGVTNDEACRAASERRDLGPSHDMFGRIVSKAARPAERDAGPAAEHARLSFPAPAAGRHVNPSPA